MLLINTVLRKHSCHINELSKSSNRKSFIKRFHLIVSNFSQLLFLLVIVKLLFVNNKIEGSLSTSKSQLKHERNGRFIFNWIKFQNDVCHAKNYNTEHHEYDEDGVCYTSEECSSRGGLHKANCAAGYGACCVFRASGNGESNEKVAYFSNPSFPFKDNLTNYLTYTIKVTDPDVCQVRLDFEIFILSGPDLSSNQPPYGRCRGDRLAIFTKKQDIGLSEGNLLCGDMTGQHIYIPVNATQGEDTVSLFAMVGSNVFWQFYAPFNLTLDPSFVDNYAWNIKIQQIDCSRQNSLKAPDGCLQYYTEETGSIESFNWQMQNSPYPALTNYAICIKRHQTSLASYCGITFAAATQGDGFMMNTNGAKNTSPIDRVCFYWDGSDDESISNDFIEVMGAYTYTSDSMGKIIPASRFCGVFDGQDLLFQPITSTFSGPIVIHVHTDEQLKGIAKSGIAQNSQQAMEIVQSGIENGFKLDYQFTNNCPDL